MVKRKQTRIWQKVPVDEMEEKQKNNKAKGEQRESFNESLFVSVGCSEN